MTDVYGLKDKTDELLLVASDLAVVACVYGKGEVPTSISQDATGDLNPLPDNWFYVGELDQKAGAKITPDIKTTDIMGYGSMQPRRTIKTEESVSVSFTAQESRKINLGMFWGLDLNDVEADANNEWSFLKSARGGLIYYSLALIGEHNGETGTVNPYWIFPKVAITKTDAISLSTEDALAYPFTFQAFEDKEYGGFIRVGQAGAGNAALNTVGGFTAGS